MAEFDMNKIQDQLNRKMAEAMAGIKAKIEAVQMTLHYDVDQQFPGHRTFSNEGESCRITNKRWEALGYPRQLNTLVGATDLVADDDTEPAPEVKDWRDKIDRIIVQEAGCTEVLFTNTSVICSSSNYSDLHDVPSLRGEQYEEANLINEPDPLSKVHSIIVTGQGCTEVYFTNGTQMCSNCPEMTDDGLPNLRDEQYVCGNPECPKAGNCGGECARNF